MSGLLSGAGAPPATRAPRAACRPARPPRALTLAPRLTPQPRAAPPPSAAAAWPPGRPTPRRAAVRPARAAPRLAARTCGMALTAAEGLFLRLIALPASTHSTLWGRAAHRCTRAGPHAGRRRVRRRRPPRPPPARPARPRAAAGAARARRRRRRRRRGCAAPARRPGRARPAPACCATAGTDAICSMLRTDCIETQAMTGHARACDVAACRQPDGNCAAMSALVRQGRVAARTLKSTGWKSCRRRLEHGRASPPGWRPWRQRRRARARPCARRARPHAHPPQPRPPLQTVLAPPAPPPATPGGYVSMAQQRTRRPVAMTAATSCRSAERSAG